ncbi:hypothetical protein F3I54_15505 [Pantoea sp. VH_18]|nr:hypothetical protein F3I55_15355 [Pantoea sp. VH_24]KAA5959623.1 hypothetical protein F3I53_12620 [Pantoea sp. VH_16]KAA5963372.1 hypothetical protein F3I54_15505 [Pantoea sp. VH_18]KAA5996742.1 hypothetical protein F3I46_13585 [Pantoea sp. M_1]KAA6005906.1 hypothetical protein F3I45_04115 [Pantoea sp. F_7]KAA6014631.1 hypothetical protein F3I43_04115 [Pantoea sp. F_18]KAA6016936.1 hypothetical protein F3I44_04115 [Pantoea sp. F_5]KAA6019349.1 hypothetical protein F3I40_04115 [Pantoea sp.
MAAPSWRTTPSSATSPARSAATLDITPAMRARIKVSAFTRGVTVAELLRGVLEREFPDNRTENLP